MIHILKEGLALCGAGAPLDWPAGDRWVAFNEDLSKATCRGCMSAGLPEVIERAAAAHRARRESIREFEVSLVEACPICGGPFDRPGEVRGQPCDHPTRLQPWEPAKRESIREPGEEYLFDPNTSAPSNAWRRMAEAINGLHFDPFGGTSEEDLRGIFAELCASAVSQFVAVEIALRDQADQLSKTSRAIGMFRTRLHTEIARDRKAEETIERLIARLEGYGFETEAGPLTKCKDWHELCDLLRERQAERELASNETEEPSA